MRDSRVDLVRAAIRNGGQAGLEAELDRIDAADRLGVLQLAEITVLNEINQALAPVTAGGTAIDSATRQRELRMLRAARQHIE